MDPVPAYGLATLPSWSDRACAWKSPKALSRTGAGSIEQQRGKGLRTGGVGASLCLES